MSATRHAQPDAPLSQERYMSSPEYAELRGLSGSAVAAKAALQTDPRARSLLMFLQALSLRPSGLNKVASDLLAMFPERIGTPSMHKFGVKPGQVYNARQVRVVRDEVENQPAGRISWSAGSAPSEEEFERQSARIAEDAELARGCGMMSPKAAVEGIRARPYSGRFPLKGEFKPLGDDACYENRDLATRSEKQPASYPAAIFVAECRRLVEECIETFLFELCLNPAWSIEPGAPDNRHSTVARLCHLHDVIGALLEFKARDEQAARASFAATTVSNPVCRTLERGLRSRKIVVAEGLEGIGKSFSAKRWCEQHLGEARFVPLRGNQTETSFYSSVWVACGLGSPVNRKVHELRQRVDMFLEQTGIMLVIDEGHRLLPQSQRIYAQPALMNWIYGLWDIGVPCALLATPQITSRLDEVERQTDWRSGQFKRRVECWTLLPQRVTEDDLRAVAPRLAPSYTARMLDELIDFALPTRRQLDAMARAISAAAFIAAEARGDGAQPTTRELLAGIEEAQQTDLASTTKFDIERQNKGAQGKRLQRRGSPSADLPPDNCGDDATGSQEPGKDTLADTQSPARTVIPLRAVTVPA